MNQIFEQLAANMGIDTIGCFTCSAEPKSILSNLRPVSSETSCVPFSVRATDVSDVIAQTEGNSSWNVAAILCGDGEFGLSRWSYFGSSSLDGAVSGFWSLILDSLTISWAPIMRHHFIDWPYRAITRNARLLLRQGKGPTRPYANIEGYPKHAARFLIKEMLKIGSWRILYSVL